MLDINNRNIPAFGARYAKVATEIGSLKKFQGDEEQFGRHVEEKMTSLIEREIKSGVLHEAYNTLDNMCTLARHKRYSAKMGRNYARKNIEAEIIEEKARGIFDKVSLEQKVKAKLQESPNNRSVRLLTKSAKEMALGDLIIVPKFLKPLINFLRNNK